MHFSDGMQVLVSIGILCAGISTLEGILLALSTIVSSDLYLGIFGKTLLKDKTEEERGRSALIVGRLSIVVLGVVTFLLSRWQIVNPTGGSVAIFAQYGVYLLIATSFIPLGAGMFLKNASRAAVIAGTLVSFAVFFAIALFKLSYMSNNPAFLATMAIISGWAVFIIVQVMIRFRSTARASGSNSGRPGRAGAGQPESCDGRIRLYSNP
jgi:SSS family solute:Na+ symporter/sodium/pantothenate symporter